VRGLPPLRGTILRFRRLRQERWPSWEGVREVIAFTHVSENLRRFGTRYAADLSRILSAVFPQQSALFLLGAAGYEYRAS
jgi:hypothetical protein